MATARLQRTGRMLLRGLLALVILFGLILAAFLPFAGRYLAVTDSLERADAIVVLAGARAERWLEALDLRREGWAARVLLSPGRLEPAERRLRAQGVRFPTDAELARDALTQLGVPPADIEILPGEVDNTAEEAAIVREVAARAGLRTLIVVTSTYHTRRARYAFERVFHGSGIRILVRPSRHGAENPARWWRSRGEFRFVTWELQKLLAYRLGL